MIFYIYTLVISIFDFIYLIFLHQYLYVLSFTSSVLAVISGVPEWPSTSKGGKSKQPNCKCLSKFGEGYWKWEGQLVYVFKINWKCLSSWSCFRPTTNAAATTWYCLQKLYFLNHVNRKSFFLNYNMIESFGICLF